MTLTIDLANPAHVAVILFIFIAWTISVACAAHSDEDSSWHSVYIFPCIVAFVFLLVSLGQLVINAL